MLKNQSKNSETVYTAPSLPWEVSQKYISKAITQKYSLAYTHEKLRKSPNSCK